MAQLRRHVLVLVISCVALAMLPLCVAGADGGVTVTIEAPCNVPAGSEFVATANITDVVDLDSFQFNLTYDPAVIQVIGAEGDTTAGVTAGLIGSKTVPVDMWIYQPPGTPGTIGAIGNIPGVVGVSGSGYLAKIHFQVIGSAGDSSPLTLTDGHLFEPTSGEITPVTWVDNSVAVVGGTPTPTVSPTPAVSPTPTPVANATPTASVTATPALSPTPGTTPTPGGGGDGGPWVPPPTPTPTPSPSIAPTPTPAPARVDISGSITGNGTILEGIDYTSPDGGVALRIGNGTVALAANRTALQSITVRVVAEEEWPEPPEGRLIVGAFDCGPDGATFSPLLALTLKCNPASLPGELGVEDLAIASYDNQTGSWEFLSVTVDPVSNTVTAEVAHFTVLAIVAEQPTVSTPTPSATGTPASGPTGTPAGTATPTPVATPAFTPTPVPGAAGFPTWGIVAIIIAVLAVAAAVFALRRS